MSAQQATTHVENETMVQIMKDFIYAYIRLNCINIPDDLSFIIFLFCLSHNNMTLQKNFTYKHYLYYTNLNKTKWEIYYLQKYIKFRLNQYIHTVTCDDTMYLISGYINNAKHKTNETHFVSHLIEIIEGYHDSPYVWSDFHSPYVPMNDKISTNQFTFNAIASDIACFNDDFGSVFSTLCSVAKKLNKDDLRYRTLDTTNPKVITRLLNYYGAVAFLMALGYEPDTLGTKLICSNKPPISIIRDAIVVLTDTQTEYMKKYSVRSKHVHYDVVQDEKETEEDMLTLEQILCWTTVHASPSDVENVETLILTHKLFTDSVSLLRALKNRFFVSIPDDIRQDEQRVIEFQTHVAKRVQLRMVKALRDWMKYHWKDDFRENEQLKQELNEWINELIGYKDLNPVNIHCTWMDKLHQILHKEFQERMETDWTEGIREGKEWWLVSPDDGIIVSETFDILTDISPQILANHMTLLSHCLFARIKAREWLISDVEKYNHILAPNLAQFMHMFYAFVIFIKMKILTQNENSFVYVTIERMIVMGERFKELNNFCGLYATFIALNSVVIADLESVWKFVSKENKQKLDEWNNIFCKQFNYRTYRELLRKCTGSSCIPSIYVFLKDLILINKDKHMRNGIRMLNFNKYICIADRIKSLQLFQNHPYATLKKQNEDDKYVQHVLLMKLSKLQNVTEHQMYEMSVQMRY
eukprot:365295_1